MFVCVCVCMLAGQGDKEGGKERNEQEGQQEGEWSTQQVREGQWGHDERGRPLPEDIHHHGQTQGGVRVCVCVCVVHVCACMCV